MDRSLFCCEGEGGTAGKFSLEPVGRKEEREVGAEGTGIFEGEGAAVDWDFV